MANTEGGVRITSLRRTETPLPAAQSPAQPGGGPARRVVRTVQAEAKRSSAEVATAARLARAVS